MDPIQRRFVQPMREEHIRKPLFRHSLPNRALLTVSHQVVHFITFFSRFVAVSSTFRGTTQIFISPMGPIYSPGS